MFLNASDKRQQQQPDSASSTSTLATTVTAGENFDVSYALSWKPCQGDSLNLPDHSDDGNPSRVNIKQLCVASGNTQEDNVGQSPTGPTAIESRPDVSFASLLIVESIRAITWGKYGLVQSMLNSFTGLFFFQFSSMEGLDSMLENGPWFIRNNPLILKKWNLDVNLMKEDAVNVLVWSRIIILSRFFHGDTTATGSSTLTPLKPKVIKVDKIILSWIFTTILDPLQKILVVAWPKTAKEAWGLLTDIVKDNKWSGTSTLKAKLRSIKLGTLNVVHYALEGDAFEVQGTCSTRGLLFSYGSCGRLRLGLNTLSNASTVPLHMPYNPTANVVYSATGPNYASQGTLYYTNTPDPSHSSVGPVSSLTSAQFHPSAPIHIVLASGLASAHVLTGPQPTQTELSGLTAPPGQPTILPHAFSTESLQDPTHASWNMDTGVSSHLNASLNSLNNVFNTCIYPSISVGDGHSILVTSIGHSILPTSTRPLHLNNVLITLYIIINLISVRQFVRDNNCTVEFDMFGFYVKDFTMSRVFLLCDSTGELYPVTSLSTISHAFLVSQHT
ncbi:ribonuclease H-like domain-containing protein [Tanacetum coccineum]